MARVVVKPRIVMEKRKSVDKSYPSHKQKHRSYSLEKTSCAIISDSHSAKNLLYHHIAIASGKIAKVN